MDKPSNGHHWMIKPLWIAYGKVYDQCDKKVNWFRIHEEFHKAPPC